MLFFEGIGLVCPRTYGTNVELWSCLVYWEVTESKVDVCVRVTKQCIVRVQVELNCVWL